MAKKDDSQNGASPAFGFGQSAPDLQLNPMLCVGKASVEDEVTQSENGPYQWFNVNFEPKGTGKKGSIRIMFQSHWLKKNFNPAKDLAYDASEADAAKALEQKDPSKLTAEQKELLSTRGQFYVYRNTIFHKDGSSLLQRLLGVGNKELNTWDKFMELLGKEFEKKDQITPEEFRKIIAALVNSISAQAYHYYRLGQERVTDPETGKKVPGERYEVKHLGIASKSEIEVAVRAAQKNDTLVTFEV